MVDTATQNGTTSSANVWAGQQPYLLDVYGKASALANSLAPQTSGVAQTYANQFTPLINQSLENYGTAYSNATTALNPILSGTSPGQQTLMDLMAGGINPNLAAMVDAAGQSVATNLSRNILPSIISRGNQANMYGGGGSGERIATGLALSDANRQMAEMATNLYGQAYDADQARRMAAAQSYTNAAAGAANQLYGMASAAPGIYSAGATDLINLGLAPYNQQWAQLLNQAGVIGGPVVLQSSGGGGGSSLGIL